LVVAVAPVVGDVMCREKLEPAARDASVQPKLWLPVEPVTLQVTAVEPVGVAGVGPLLIDQFKPARPGRASVTETPDAVLCPVLETVIVKPTALPADTDAASAVFRM
jgi:hypothetical protein